MSRNGCNAMQSVDSGIPSGTQEQRCAGVVSYAHDAMNLAMLSPVDTRKCAIAEVSWPGWRCIFCGSSVDTQPRPTDQRQVNGSLVRERSERSELKGVANGKKEKICPMQTTTTLRALLNAMLR